MTDTSIIHAILKYAEDHGIKPTVVGTRGIRSKENGAR